MALNLALTGVQPDPVATDVGTIVANIEALATGGPPPDPTTSYTVPAGTPVAALTQVPSNHTGWLFVGGIVVVLGLVILVARK